MFKPKEKNYLGKALVNQKEYNHYLHSLLTKALTTGSHAEWQTFITTEGHLKLPWQQVNLFLLKSLELFLTERDFSPSQIIPKLLQELCVNVFEFILKGTDLLEPSLAKYFLYLQLLEINFNWRKLVQHNALFYSKANLVFIQVKAIYFHNLCYFHQKTTKVVWEAELTLYIKLIKNKDLNHEEAALVIGKVPNLAQQLYYYNLINSDLKEQGVNISFDLRKVIDDVIHSLDLQINVERIRGEVVESFTYIIKTVELNYLKQSSYSAEIRPLLIKLLKGNYELIINRIIELANFSELEKLIVKFLINDKTVESEVPIGIKLNISTFNKLYITAIPQEKSLLEALRQNTYYPFNSYQRVQARLNIFLSEELTEELRGVSLEQWYLKTLNEQAIHACWEEQLVEEKQYETQLLDFFSPLTPPLKVEIYPPNIIKLKLSNHFLST